MRAITLALPLAAGCALAKQGDPPEPILDGDAMGGSGGAGSGGSGLGGATGGASTGGSTATGGSAGASGTSATGGASTSGGSTATGGAAGESTGGASGFGGAGSGTAGSNPTGGSAGRGGAATGGTSGGGNAGKGGAAGSPMGGAGSGAAGGPPGGTELFRDNFEMGATNWTATPNGSWAIATDGSMVYASSGAAANSTWRAAAAGQASWTDVQIDARVKITSFPGSSTSYYAGICARYTSNSNYACFALRSDGKIAFRVNGSNTSAVDPSSGAIRAGTWYTVRVVARGATITAFLNGVEIPSGSRVTSGAPASGRVALACPGANVEFDDVVVSTPE